MASLIWSLTGTRFYETGVDRGVLYPPSGIGVSWNGLVSVEESVFGGEVDPSHFDGVKYLDVVLASDFQATIEALSAPAEFSDCNGTKALSPGLFATQQQRYTFGLSYRTRIGNDVDDVDHGYKLHLVYNATSAPSSKTHKTITNTADPETQQWTINTVPVPSATYKPTAHFVIDSTVVSENGLGALEGALYGFAYISIIDGGSPSFSSSPVIEGGTYSSTSSDVVDGGLPALPSETVPYLPTPDAVLAFLDQY